MKNHKSSPERHVAIYGSHDKKSKRWELSGSEAELKKVLPLAVQHPPKRCFPRFTKSPLPKIVLGDHDIDMVKIDWDERSITEVKRFCKIMVNRYPVLGGGFIILQSSVKTRKIRSADSTKIAYTYKSKSYHAVFNGEVSKDELDSILAWLCLFVKDPKLDRWYFMQKIKRTYSLRIGFKGKKKPPKIVYRYPKDGTHQDKQIAKFLENGKFILDFLESNRQN